MADVSDGLLDIVIIEDSGSSKHLDEIVSMKEGDLVMMITFSIHKPERFQ